MADTTTFFTKILSFFSALWACILTMLSLKHRSTIHADDLEVGIPSVERQLPGHFNAAFPVVSGSRSIDGFVDISFDPDTKTKDAKAVSIPAHILPTKTTIDTGHCHSSKPAVKRDIPVSLSLPAVPTISKLNTVDNISKHQAFKFGPYSVEQDRPKPKSKSRRHRDSISDLLDQFPSPPTHIPISRPLVSQDVVPQIVEKTPLAPIQNYHSPTIQNCPSPTISEASTVNSSSGSSSILSADTSISISISISVSNETANTSVHEILELPCTSAIFKVLSSGIDVKDKNITRLTLVHNPETLTLPAMPKSLCTFNPTALPKIYHDVVDSPKPADLQKGDISENLLSKEREKVDTPAFILKDDDHISRGKRYEADLQSLGDALAPVHHLEDSSHRHLGKHRSLCAPIQFAPCSAVDTPAFELEDGHISQGRGYESDLEIQYALVPIHHLEAFSHQHLNKHRSLHAPIQVAPHSNFDTPPFILEDDHISRGKRYGASLQSLEVQYASAPVPHLQDSSHRPQDNHTSITVPVQAVLAAQTERIRPVVPPLHIVKKNKVQPGVVPLDSPIARRPLSGNWEQAVDDILQAFREAELEDQDFRDLFSGNDSFVSQSSEINASADDKDDLNKDDLDDKGDLDGRDEYYEDCERRLEGSFCSIESLSMVITPPDLIALKVEDLANVSLSSECGVPHGIMEVKGETKITDMPLLRVYDYEGSENSFTAVTNDDDDDDQWSDRLELDEYAQS